jgi:hypothetical protein
MLVNFVLLWWHIPFIALVLGLILMKLGSYEYMGPFGWPSVGLTNMGIIGVILSLLSIATLFGGMIRGLFL